MDQAEEIAVLPSEQSVPTNGSDGNQDTNVAAKSSINEAKRNKNKEKKRRKKKKAPIKAKVQEKKVSLK